MYREEVDGIDCSKVMVVKLIRTETIWYRVAATAVAAWQPKVWSGI